MFRFYLLDVTPYIGPFLGVFPPRPCTLFGLHHSYGFPQNDESLLKSLFIYSLWSLLTTTVVGEDQVWHSLLPQS